MREITDVVYVPQSCAVGVMAQTHGRWGRACVLCADPVRLAVVDIAVLPSHEARHHFTDEYGRHWRIPHSCTDAACSEPWACAAQGSAAVTAQQGQRPVLPDAAIDVEFGPVTWTGAVVGAALGVLLHVPIDAMMHSDVKPFAPWTDANPFFIPGSFEWLHVACLAAGVLGLGLWAWRVRRQVPARG